jgi:chromosome segregation ATPase
MAQISRKKIFVSNEDLKKSIVNANKSLDARNKILGKNIKDKESEIKSLDKENKSLNNEIKSISKEISSSKSLLSKEKLKLYDMSKNIKDRESHLLTLKNEESSINKNVEKLNKEALKLNDDVAYLETKKKKVDDLIEDVDCIQKQKEIKENELNEIQRKYRAIKEDISNQELYFKNKSFEYNKQIAEMSDEAKEVSAKIKVIQKDADEEKVKYDDACNKLKEMKKDKSLELKSVESLVDKKEDEYIMWERKLENIKESYRTEQERISKIKGNFEKWKVNSLEEVARLKLKNKMEKIDKAGLTEILNG